MKERLDVLLVKRGLAVSREKAKAVIMAGIVYVENQKEDKAGSMFPYAKYMKDIITNKTKIRKPRRIETGKSHDTFRCDPG